MKLIEVKLPEILPQDCASQWKLIEDLLKKHQEALDELYAPPPREVECKFI